MIERAPSGLLTPLPQPGAKEHQVDVWGMSSLQHDLDQPTLDIGEHAWKEIGAMVGEMGVQSVTLEK